MLTHPVLTASAKRRPRCRSPVNTAESRPCGEELTVLIASSSPAMTTAGITGPKVSSLATSISPVTSVSTVAR